MKICPKGRDGPSKALFGLKVGNGRAKLWWSIWAAWAVSTGLICTEQKVTNILRTSKCIVKIRCLTPIQYYSLS